MGFAALYRKKKDKVPASLQTLDGIKNRIENGLALDAGTAKTKSVDPVYHITESFINTFESTGRRRAGQLAEKAGYAEGSSLEERSNTEEKGPEGPRLNENGEQRLGGPEGEAPDKYQGETAIPGDKSEAGFYRRFSETAFAHGKLAASVLRDGGKTMFVSCLKRSLGQSEPSNSKQSGLFSDSPDIPVRNTLGRVVFNRYSKSAVGLVADSIMSARQTLELFKRMAAPDADKAAPGVETEALRTLYPFLDLSQDEKRMDEYQSMLLQLTRQEEEAGGHAERTDIASKKAMLTAGMTKTSALIAKKHQMQQHFFNHLEELLESSKRAQEQFTAPDFAEEITEEILNPVEPPPGDDGKGKGKGKGTGRKTGTDNDAGNEGGAGNPPGGKKGKTG